MTIKKFKSFNEAADALWVLEPDNKYYEKLRELNNFWNRLNRVTVTKGIQRFKSYEDFLTMKEKVNI